VHGEDQLRGAGLARRDSLAEDDRRFRVAWRHLHAAEAARRDVDVEPPAEFFVERFGAVDVGNGDEYHFEFHVHDYCSSSLFQVLKFITRAQGRLRVKTKSRSTKVV